MFALAAHLQSERNINILVFCPEKNEAFCTSLGLDFVSIWPQVDMTTNDDMRKAAASGDAGGLFDAIAKLRVLGIPTGVRAVIKAMRSFCPDLILTGPLDNNLADAVSVALRVPVVVGFLQLNALSSQITSFLGERRFHYLSWLAVFLIINKTVDAVEGPLLRAAFGDELPADRLLLADCSYARCLHEWNHPISPVLVSASAHVSPKPTDLCPAYDSRLVLTGAWVVEQDRQIAISTISADPASEAPFGGAGTLDALTAFLAHGPKPVYVGWGSMLAGTPERMAQLAVRALKQAEQRGVLGGGAARLSVDMLEGAGDDAAELVAYARAHVLFVHSAPHEWLFPQCTVVVHHGGAGTTAAAMRSGTPAVVTPMLVDQFENAARTARAKAGVAMPQFTKVTPAALASALRTCLQPEMQAAAAALGTTLRAEDGLGAASERLERFYKEEVCTGVYAAAFDARVAARAHFRKRRLLRGGLLGALHSAAVVFKLLVGLAKAP